MNRSRSPVSGTTIRGRYASEFGFVDLRQSRGSGVPRAQHSSPGGRGPVAHHPSYEDPSINQFGTPLAASHRRRENHSARGRSSHLGSEADLSIGPVLPRQPPITADSRDISQVYRRKNRGEHRAGLTYSSSQRMAHHPDDFYDETPVVDFNSQLPYYATAGHHRRALHTSEERRRHRTVVMSADHLMSPTKRSHHKPQAMVDAPPLANTVRLHEDEAIRAAAASPYQQSVRASTVVSSRRGLGSSFTMPVGVERPAPSSPRPADLVMERRDTVMRAAETSRSAGWSARVGTFGKAGGQEYDAGYSSRDGPRMPDDHDDSGDDVDAELVHLPPRPQEELEMKRAAAERSHKAVGASTPWPFHPDMDVPLSLLLQRGVSIYDHRDLSGYHMHHAFLADIGFAKGGSTLVKYPRRSGMPHERHVAIEMMPVETGDAAFLVWRSHSQAVAYIDRIPLAHLVGITPDDRSGSFSRFIADKMSAEAKQRALRRLAKPLDAISMPSPLPHYSVQLTGLDTDMVGATAPGTMLVGPTLEDDRRQLLPRTQCFSLWFVNPRTKEARSIDLLAPQPQVWVRWIDLIHGIVAINNVSVMPGMAEEDRRADDEGDAAQLSSASARAPMSLDGSAGRTDEMMRYAVAMLERDVVGVQTDDHATPSRYSE